MKNLNQSIAQAIAGHAPRFAETSCSQCGRDTGPGNSGHSSCATHTTTPAPDLSGLFDYEYETSLGLCLHCHLEHEESEDGGRDHPSTPEGINLVYAFAGLIDISEVLSEEVVGLIEEEALANLRQQATDNRDDARIERYLDRMAA